MLDRILQIGDLDLDFTNVILETVNSANKIRIDIRNPDDVSPSMMAIPVCKSTISLYIQKRTHNGICGIHLKRERP